MTNKKVVPVKPGEVQLVGKVNIDAQQMASVLVADAEEKLFKAKYKLEAKMSEIKKDINTDKTEISKIISDESIKLRDSTIKKYTAVLKPIAPKGSQIKTTTETTDNIDPIIVTITVTAEVVKVGKSQGSLTSSKRDDGISTMYICAKESVNVPKSVGKLQDKISGLTSKLDLVETDLLEVKKNLSNMNYLERQAKAWVTRTTLKSMDNGEELLKGLESLNIPIIDKILKDEKEVKWFTPL